MPMRLAAAPTNTPAMNQNNAIGHTKTPTGMRHIAEIEQCNNVSPGTDEVVSIRRQKHGEKQVFTRVLGLGIREVIFTRRRRQHLT
jgi:hypothetical protein